MKITDISVIGCGAVGSALARTLHSLDIPIAGVYNRSIIKARRLADVTGSAKYAVFPTSSGEIGSLCLICVTDDAISDTAARLAELKGDFSGKIITHTSGTKPASALSALKPKKGTIASFHPLQTIGESDGPEIFEGCHISMQGDEAAMPELTKLGNRMKAHPLIVSKQTKTELHLAAVFACNYLVTLMEAANRSVKTVPGLSVTNILGPLVQTTLENIRNKGIDNALTGPVMRGDAGTLKSHLSLLEDPLVNRLYRQLGLITIQIAERQQVLTPAKAGELKKILEVDD